MSSLDKVFEYFSSQERGSSRYMLPKDLLHALVPTYPASRSTEERSGSLAGGRLGKRGAVAAAQRRVQHSDLGLRSALCMHNTAHAPVSVLCRRAAAAAARVEGASEQILPAV